MHRRLTGCLALSAERWPKRQLAAHPPTFGECCHHLLRRLVHHLRQLWVDLLPHIGLPERCSW